MPAASLNLQRGIHVTPKLRHETFKGKRVELCGELLSLRQKLPSLGKKLPCFAVKKSKRLAAGKIRALRSGPIKAELNTAAKRVRLIWNDGINKNKKIPSSIRPYG